MKEVKIVLTFDLDPDFESHLKISRDRWKGLKIGCEKLILALYKKFNFYVPVSWFVRVDDEVKKEFGGYFGLIKKNKILFKKLHDLNGRFYLHPHLYSFDSNEKKWTQETNQKKILSQLQRIIKSVKKNKTFNSKVIRIGGHYFSNEILGLLLKNNFLLDSTSLPGRVGGFIKPFDWKKSDEKIHFLKLKKQNKSIIEAPPSMIKIKANYDKRPFKRYLDLTFKNSLISKYKKNININSNNYLMTLSHPFQFISKGKHGLLSNGVNNYMKNLELILKIITNKGYKYRFCYIEDLIKKNKKLKTYER